MLVTGKFSNKETNRLEDVKTKRARFDAFTFVMEVSIKSHLSDLLDKNDCRSLMKER